MAGYADIPEYEQEPALSAPLLYQLAHYLLGNQAPRWSATDYGIGMSTGNLTRPWPGVKSPFSRLERITQPKSYVNPTEITLPESSSGLAELLRSLGGTYTGIKR